MDRGCSSDRFQAAEASAFAGRPLLDHVRVPQFTGGMPCAMHQFSVADDPGADSSLAVFYVNHVIRHRASAEGPLCHGFGACEIQDHHRGWKHLFENMPERHLVKKLNCGRHQHRAFPAVH